MKMNKKKTTMLIILIGLLSSGILALIMQNYTQYIGGNSVSGLETSDPSISILTPEDKSYSNPMYGYFPSTYGFDNEQSGASGTDIGFVDIDFSNGTSSVHVEDELDGHKKVIHCENTESGWWGFTHTLDEPFIIGTVEFYWRTMSRDVGSWVFSFADISLDWGIIIYQNMLDGGDLWYFGQSGTYHDLNFRPIFGMWYHFSISINTNNDTWSLMIDGRSLGTDLPFQSIAVDSVYYIHMRSWNLDTPAHFYYDAFGITGQSDDYQIGDNLHEGLFINYQTTFDQEWAAYSLDGASNTTILGSHTIQMPNFGTHNIRIFANDSSGTYYQSDKRYFTVGGVEIITPQNITYTEPNQGHFPSSFGFENTRNGEKPTGWTDLSSGNCFPQVIDEFQGHKKVLNITDNDNNGAASIGKNIPSLSTGTIEFWMFPNYTNGFMHFTVFSGSKIFFQLYIDEIGKLHLLTRLFGIIDSQTIHNISGEFRDWHRFAFTFNTGTDIYGLSVDGVLLVENAYSWRSTGPIDSFRFTTHTSSGLEPFSLYLDAVGVTGLDDGYEVGDNLREGLIISYKSPLALPWIGYSLDGIENNTIDGNHTIPIPIDGIHTLQLHYQDSLGKTYSTEVRYFTVDLPNPPINVHCDSGYYNILLEWDPPEDTGPVSQYNVYRGDIPAGEKFYVGSSISTSFTDISVEYNKKYYYIIRAENEMGESADSEEVCAIAGPYIRWQAPSENEKVILPVGDSIFDFSYEYIYLDDIKLFLNGIDYGSVKDENSTILTPYNSSIDGSVHAVLYGYEGGNPNPIVNDSRNFIFGKLTHEDIELLDENTEFLGNQLYLILHDPCGDNSYSGFAEQTGLSFGIGTSVSISTGFGIKGGGPTLFGVGVGASAKLSLKWTDKYDFRFEITEKTELTSSLEDSNKDYIGPGYGDTYWGEAWTFNWQLIGMHRSYFNGTDRYEDPNIYYGIIRSGEVLLGDQDAPAEWRALNPVHNDWANVEWGVGSDDNITVGGGRSYSYTKEVTTSNTRTFEFQMNLDTSVSIYFPGVTLSFTFGLEIQTYMESEVTNVYTTSYTVYDDESTDFISMQRGIDSLFGTPIFRTNPQNCKTSKPLEHNTIDYVPPLIAFPNIKYDSSLDGLAPCVDDSPIVTVDIFDEGVIQSALIFISINDGNSWDFAELSEQIANPGTWQGTIPAYDHGTTVLWYIKVWDGGLYSNRTDPHGNPYQYTVINRAPTIHITTPNGNEAFENTVRIEWSAGDLDEDDLTFTIAYNLANTGWRLIETSFSGTYYDWDISSLEFCDTTLIKVTVNDSFGGSSYDESDYVFTIGEPENGVSGSPGPNWTLILVIGSLCLVGAAFTIVIFIRRSRIVKE